MKFGLELFAGRKSFGKIFEKSMNIISIDIDEKFNCSLTKDILKIDVEKDLYKSFDVIWASPPCTSFSIAGCRYHRKNGLAISKEARLGDKLVKKTLQIIKHYEKINPKLIWFIENPTGLLRKQNYMQKYNKYLNSITYCQYGLDYMKPTDIWTNLNWTPRKKCKNGDKCHVGSPRGSKNGLQQIPYRSPERSIVPKDLILELYNNIF